MAPRILVADDDAWILRMVTTVLRKRGYEVDTAADGEQAYERAISDPPDLLITDVMMPNMDGWTLVKLLRGHPELRTMPVIFLTALGSDDDRIHGFRLGAEDFLSKPFRFEELDLRVAKTLRRGQLPLRELPDDPMGQQQVRRDSGAGGGGRADTESQGNPDAALVGDLGQIGLPMLLTMLEMEGKSGILELHHEPNEVAELYLRHGRVVRAVLEHKPNDQQQGAAGAESGAAAGASVDTVVLQDAECVYHLLHWSTGRFEFKPGEVLVDDQVGASTTQLLMEGARRMDEMNEATRRMDDELGPDAASAVESS